MRDRRRIILLSLSAFLVLGIIALRLFQSLQHEAPSVLPIAPFLVPRLLDGILVAEGQEKTRSVGVLIDGMDEGRPTVGLAQAPLVWEVPVEGGITRFLAIYLLDRLPKRVGPIRSLRPYFLDFAAEVGALLLHVGGSPEALARAKIFPLERLNQFFDDQYFWRSTDRKAPHNVFTSQFLVQQAFGDRGYSEQATFSPWQYTDDAVSSSSGDGVQIDYSTSPYRVEWQWNGARGVYERAMGGVRHVDDDGEPVDAKNVLVQFTTVEILDTIGRRRITTDGEGKAIVLTAGHRIEGRWKKMTGDRTRFYDATDVEVELQRGTTWVEVVPSTIHTRSYP